MSAAPPAPAWHRSSNGATVVMLTAAGYRHPQIMSNIWALVERFRPTVLGMVPTSWGAALNAPSEVST